MAWRWLCTTGLMFLSTWAWSDGLADLRAYLDAEPAQQPLQGELQVQSSNRDMQQDSVRRGRAVVAFVQKGGGIQLHYSAQLLSQLREEKAKKANDPDVETPTITAMDHVIASELESFLNPKIALAHVVNSLAYQGQETTQYQGAPARKLVFKGDQQRVPEKHRKHLKTFEETVTLWVDAQGMPLAQERSLEYSGRAMLVIKFSGEQRHFTQYTRANTQLLVEKFEYSERNSGGGNDTHKHIVKALSYR